MSPPLHHPGEGRFGELRWHEEHELKSPAKAAAAAERAEAEAEGAAWAEAAAGGEGGAASQQPVWEHASIEAVGEADLTPYLN